jgi:nucleoside-diphosphate-sugar epimerase
MLDAGCRVIAIDRVFDMDLKQRWSARYHKNLEILETDLSDLPHLEVDTLVHGAAVTASPEERGETPIANFRANLEPLLEILEWSTQHNVHRVFLISSSAVYRETPPGAVSEAMPTTPLGVYAVAKAATEALAETYRILYDWDVVVIRLSFIYGLEERARPTRPHLSLIGRMVQQAFEQGTITFSTQDHPRDWTFASDIGKAIYHLMQQRTLRHAIYNVASEQVMSLFDIAKAIQKYLPHVQLNQVDSFDPLARLGYLSHARIFTETGFTDWTPFDEGIRKIVAAQQEVLS